MKLQSKNKETWKRQFIDVVQESEACWEYWAPWGSHPLFPLIYINSIDLKGGRVGSCKDLPVEMTWFAALTLLLILTTIRGSPTHSVPEKEELMDHLGELEDDGLSSGERALGRYSEDFGLGPLYSPLLYNGRYFKRTPFNSWGGKRSMSGEIGPRVYNFLDKLSFNGNGKRQGTDTRSQNDQTVRRANTSPLFSSWRG